MKRNFIFSSIAMSVLLLGTGCGGSDSNDNQNNANRKVGHYVDAAVSGVNYSCTSANRTYNGTTDRAGTFYYEDGQVCTFTIGGVELRRANVSTMRDNVLFEDNIRTAQFLQTLDNNANPNDGIEITASVANALANQRWNTVPTTYNALITLVTALQTNTHDYHGTATRETAARTHVGETRIGLTNGGWHFP